MSNLIPDSERDIYRAVITDMHDTFARDITVWQRSAERVNPLNPNHDAFYDNPKKPNVTYTTQSSTIPARVKYIDKQDKEYALAIASAGNQIQITQETQLVRIKVKAAEKKLVEDAEKVTVDDQDFSLLSVARPHGLFDNDYATFYLRAP